MSYDLYLRDPVTRQLLEVPAHMMYGGIIRCEEIGGKLVPTTTTEAYLNITYNYSSYYHGAFPGLEDDLDQHERDRLKYGITEIQGGIRSLNGLTGLQAIPVLEEMIRRIELKYRGPEGWIDTEREKVWFEDRKDQRITKDPTEMLTDLFRHLRDGMSEEEAAKYLDDRWKKKETKILVNEGGSGDYWCPTAANAIRPLYQLIALSRMRPDGIWSEES